MSRGDMDRLCMHSGNLRTRDRCGVGDKMACCAGGAGGVRQIGCVRGGRERGLQVSDAWCRGETVRRQNVLRDAGTHMRASASVRRESK